MDNKFSMRNRKYIYLLGLLVAVSCLKQEVKPAPVSVSEPVPISFNVLQQEFTKTVAVTTADIVSSGFYANATTGSEGSEVQAFANALFTVSGDEFVSENIVWPMSDPGYRFYGCNVSMTHSSDGPYVDVTSDTDVVCAVNTSPVYNNSNGLTFKHIFARVSTVTVAPMDGYNISDITIWLVNAKTGGTYNLRTGNGQSDGTGWCSLTPAEAADTQLFRYAGEITDGNSETGSDNNLYIVPGKYYLKGSWVSGGNSYSGILSDSPINIVAGKVNPIACLIEGAGGIILSTLDGITWE